MEGTRMTDTGHTVRAYLAAHRRDMADALAALVRIPSVKAAPLPGAPFGRACADALLYTQALYEKEGFATQLDADGGYLLAGFGDGAASLGLFAHADVIAAGNGWTVTDPFVPAEKDGCLFGRGALDDKAAVILSLWCAKTLCDLALPFRSRLVCFTGTNEESGMRDILHYLTRHTPPDFALVPDSAFPPYRGNKGILLFEAAVRLPAGPVETLSADNCLGQIPGSASARLRYDEKLFAALETLCDGAFTVRRAGGSIRAAAFGHAGHTALPEGTVNAGGILADRLSRCPMLDEETRAALAFAAAVMTHHYGEPLGIADSDPDFGRLTIACDAIRLRNGRLTLHFNIRCGARVYDGLPAALEKAFSGRGWRIRILSRTKPHLLDADDPLLDACLRVWQACSGRRDAPRINAGGTYAMHLPKAIEIGPVYARRRPPLPAGHGAVHQPDEYADIDGLLQATEIAVRMLLACDERLHPQAGEGAAP